MVGVENVWIYVIIGVVILAGAIAYGVNLTRGRGAISYACADLRGPLPDRPVPAAAENHTPVPVSW